MYKVFVNHQAVHFTNSAPALMSGNSDICIHEPLREELQLFIDKLEQGQIPGTIYFTGKSPEKIYADFCSCYKPVIAAGGVVMNPDGDILFIQRLGKWDLPKGKAMPAEDIAAAALREVEEETGIHDAVIVKALPSTFHTYTMHGERILKTTHWFEMKSSGAADLIPQTEEDITTVRWISRDESDIILANTYPSLIELVKSVFTLQ